MVSSTFPSNLTADYTLIWDQRFVRLLKEHEPMDYTAPKPKTVEKVQQEDLNEVGAMCHVERLQ